MAVAHAPNDVSREAHRLDKSHLSPADLRSWRLNMGMTQPELAEELEVSTLTVYRWEKALSAIPPYLHLALDSVVLDLGHCTCRGRGAG